MRRTLAALAPATLFLPGCQSGGKATDTDVHMSWGPGIHVRRQHQEEPTPQPDGDATVTVNAGEDVGYHVEVWRDKPYPEGSTAHDPEPKKER